MPSKLQVVFHCELDGQKITAEADPGELLTQVAYRAQVLIQQTCGGTPSCTDCKIKVLSSHGEAFEAMEGAEARLMGNVYFITKERLSCQAHVKNSCEVFVPKPPPRKEKILNKRPNTGRVPFSNDTQPPGGGIFHGKQKENQTHQKSGQKGRQENGQEGRQESRQKSGEESRKEKAGRQEKSGQKKRR